MTIEQNIEQNRDERGRDAEWPSQIPLKGWKDIAWRLWRELNEDRVLLIAAGATFYLLLALFPALTAFVSTYGFFADPVVVAEHVATLGALLPAGGLEIIQERLESLATQESGALSIGFVGGFLFAYWSANNGVKTLFEALNVAYEETEKRSFLRLNLIALAFTLGAMVTAVVLISAVALLPIVINLLYLGAFTEALLGALRWVIMLIVIAVGISILYRFGPSRARAKWRWINWGSGFATIVWVVTSIGFSYYLQNFANYEATYGSLGAVIGFMMWTWISVIILIVGAQINAEMEHQTARDSTTGSAEPMGSRGAVVADTLGDVADPEPGAR
jgi:membrane protein